MDRPFSRKNYISSQAKFSQEDGVRLLKSCTYHQEATQYVKMLQVVNSMFKANTGNSTSQLLLILSDGRGIYNEGKAKVLEQVRKLKLANVFIVFVIIETNSNESVVDMVSVSFDENTQVIRMPYLEQFPFSFYMILKDIVNLPKSLSDSIKQWFELVSKNWITHVMLYFMSLEFWSFILLIFFQTNSRSSM